MGKIHLKRLTLNNFRSFEGKHDIEFDSTGLYLVRGFNHDSRGESGSGKSTILLAIAYALDYSPYSATELRTWLNDEPFHVELELVTANGPAIVHRGDKLWLKYESKKITSAKAVSEKLDEICGMNKRLREAITYRKQRTFGLFLSKNDSQKKEFLVELLGLHWLEEAIEDAVKQVSNAEKAINERKPIIELCEKMVAEARVPEAIVIDTAAQENHVEELRQAVIWAGARYQKLQDEAKPSEYSISPAPFEPDTSEVIRLDGLLNQCKQRMARLGQPEILVHRAQREIFRLHAETHKLFDDKCPRCDRQWDRAREELERANQAIQHQEEKLKEAERALDLLKAMRETEANIAQERELALQDIHRAQSEHIAALDELMAEPRKALFQKQIQIDSAFESLKLKESMWNEAANRLSGMKSENEFNARIRNQCLSTFIAAKKRLDDEQSKIELLMQEWSKERDYRDMLRGFLGQIFGEVLQEISEETNRILANLPNAQKMTMRFETSRETGEGKLRNEITPVAYFGGRLWPLESGASGGMFTSVELAVDLAVRAVIARRTGVDLGWLILDESFANGSDKVTKEGCLEILKQYSEDSLIIVVDHASEFKEMFSRVIEVDYQNERSKVR